MPDHLVEIIFALLSVVYLMLYARDYLKNRTESKPARKAWLRVGLIFGIVSILLFYLQS